MSHLLGNDMEDTRTNRVRSNGIIRKYNLTYFGLYTVEWAIPFHGDDRVGDHEVGPDGGADVENAFVNSCPVQNIFRPAVPAAWDYPEHVFHAECDPGPVMRFD